MKYVLLALAGAASLTACSNDDSTATLGKDVVMHNDFESMAGWIPDATALTQEQAHSGHYSLKVDKDHEYSLGYNQLLGQLSPTRLRGVRIDAWAYATEKDPTAQLRVALNSTVGGQSIAGEGIAFDSQVKAYGKWVKVSKEFIFPPNVNYTTQLVMYLWSGGGPHRAYIDDVQLTALR